MSRRAILPAALLALLPGGCAAPVPPSGAACVPKPLAQLPVEFHEDVPTVTVVVDGWPVSMVLDLGANRTVIAEETAERLNLDRDPSDLPTVTGIGGSETRWAAVARHLSVGGITLDNKRMEVASIGAPETQQSIGGLLGLDVLLRYDLDWDLGHHQVTLNAASGCTGPPAGWSSGAVAVTLGRSRAWSSSGSRSRLLLLAVQVDDKPVSAMLDTGTGVSMIGSDFAASLEALPEQGDKRVQLSGTGVDSVDGTAHRFRSLTAAGDTLPGWPMVVGPVPANAGEMILGADFMRIHRAWLPAGGSTIWFGPRS